MKRAVGNIAASVQAKLKNRADESGYSFNEILQYYGMERFLYRLSKTPYANDFILKGGLMFYGLGIPGRRFTRDIDFLGVTDYTKQDILSVFRAAMSVSAPDDGVLFDSKTLRLSQTRAAAHHGGIRVTFVGSLGKARIPMQVDIGFSDELASEALNIDYPVLLAGMEKPQLRGYPPESIVSEKFYAMVRFSNLNSRWKDYYDIYMLADTIEFESQALSEAIKATFGNRPAKLTDEIPSGLRDEFAVANQGHWESFLYKSKLQNNTLQDLRVVVNRIRQFLEYPLHELRSGAHTRSKRWSRDIGWQ